MTDAIEAKDVKRLLMTVYKKYQRGQITEQQAYKESYILNTVLKAIEVTDLETRLKNIESILKHND